MESDFNKYIQSIAPDIVEDIRDLSTPVDVGKLVMEMHNLQTERSALKRAIYEQKKVFNNIMRDIDIWSTLENKIEYYNNLLYSFEKNLDNNVFSVKSQRKMQAVENYINGIKIDKKVNVVDNMIEQEVNMDSTPREFKGLAELGGVLNYLRDIKQGTKETFEPPEIINVPQTPKEIKIEKVEKPKEEEEQKPIEGEEKPKEEVEKNV